MTTHAERVAMWHRLRNDPDFQPEWLRFMGQQPPVERVDDYRAWGDGVGDARPHVITDISFADGWAECRCGETIESSGGPSMLEDLWDVHRGLDPQRVAERRLLARPADEATDEEVGSFLSMAAMPGYAYEATE